MRVAIENKDGVRDRPSVQVIKRAGKGRLEVLIFRQCWEGYDSRARLHASQLPFPCPSTGFRL
jgi:hypothetical protein